MDTNYLLQIAIYIPLLPAIIALFKWKMMSLTQKRFTILLWAVVVISLSGRLWTIITESSNLPFYHSYILIEYLLIIRVFRLMLPNVFKSIHWLILEVGFLLVWLLNIYVANGWWDFPDYIHALEALLIVSLVIIWFNQMLKAKKILQPERTFEFWMCSGMLIYFLGNFMLFLFPKFLLSSGNEVFHAIWKVNCVLIILLYLMYSFALYWVKKPKIKH